MDTKFCYYNNYNVNQPRYFCKNCQRYWTSGGTMRNVPIGAGSRKSKNMMSHYHHITVPEALHNARSDIPVEVHSTLSTNGSVRTCTFDVSLSESMSSILNPIEKSSRNFQPNDIDASNSKDEASQSFVKEAMSAGLNCIPFPNKIPCYPCSPWSYPTNSNQWSPSVAAPPFFRNGFPMPIYPTPAYWGCTVPGTWNIQWITQSSPTSASSPSSSPNSRIGKLSRDGNVLCLAHSEENNFEQSPWFPKTSRFHNPGEVVKSSVWTTLGINHNDKFDSIRRGSTLFKGFQTKHIEGNSQVDSSVVLEANPTALSMSQNFQENS
ncbi:unnamed protein product [Amaranthus hypochondriacus]